MLRRETVCVCIESPTKHVGCMWTKCNGI